jgi:mono/diheme cytochrome c family protein
MRKVLKWIGIVLGGLVGLILLAVVAVFVLSGLRINKTYDIEIGTVSIPTDTASIESGQHMATIRGCIDCHGENLGGEAFIEEPPLARLYATNLTSGKGGIGSTYTDADWERAIRHGVGPDGKPLLFMPAQEFYYLSDADLGEIIAYVKSVPPADNELPANTVGLLGRVLLLSGQIELLPVEVIDHTGPRPSAPEPGVTVEYGEYLAVGCIGCHGQDFSGGPIAGAPPDWPPPPNLTPGGELAGWSEEDFITAMRTGVTPIGRQLRNEYMPWELIGQMTDDELKSVWLYLQSLPPKE